MRFVYKSKIQLTQADRDQLEKNMRDKNFLRAGDSIWFIQMENEELYAINDEDTSSVLLEEGN